MHHQFALVLVQEGQVAERALRDDAGALDRVREKRVFGLSSPLVEAEHEPEAGLPEAQRLFRDDFMFIPWYKQTMSRWAAANVAGMEKNLDWQIVAPWAIAIG